MAERPQRTLNPEGHALLTLKEGVKAREGAGGRVFTSGRMGLLRAVFEKLNLTVVDFSRQVSKIRTTDVWLGYALRKQNFGGNQRIV